MYDLSRSQRIFATSATSTIDLKLRLFRKPHRSWSNILLEGVAQITFISRLKQLHLYALDMDQMMWAHYTLVKFFTLLDDALFLYAKWFKILTNYFVDLSWHLWAFRNIKIITNKMLLNVGHTSDFEDVIMNALPIVTNFWLFFTWS